MTGQGSGNPANGAIGKPKGPRKWLRDGLLRRTFTNAGRLMGGKTIGGLFALGYLALAARALGPEQFGTLVLIHTYVLVIAGLVKFRSWQAIIRYGAKCLKPDQRTDFQKLLKFTTLLDVGSAIVGALVAVALAPVVGRWMGWDASVVALTASYGWLILFMIEATPTGVLRLFDRFNLLAAQSTVTPFLRLLGVSAAYLSDAELADYVFVWFVAAAAGRLVLLILGWAELRRQKLLSGIDISLAGLSTPHTGLWKFVWYTNFNASIGLMLGHVTTMAVGIMLGAVDAGLFKIAREFAGVLGKPAQLLTHAIYPDLAKLWSDGNRKAAGKLILRSGLIAGGGATAVFAGIVILGQPLLSLIVGDAFLGAYGIMVLLALGKTVSIFGFPLTPAMYAMGRPGLLLRINVILTLIYFFLLLGLLNAVGRIGAGTALVVWALMTSIVVAITVGRLLGRGPAPLVPVKK